MQLIKKILTSKNTSEGKGKQRIRRASLSGIVSLTNRVLTLGTSLISIPLTVQYLGEERFGMWLILSSFLTWVSIVDLGLTNSLTNALATADGKEDRNQAKEMVSSAFLLMLGLVALVILVFSFIYFYVPWAQVLNIKSSQAKEEVNTVVLIVMLIFVLRLPLSIPKRIYDAYQEGYIYQIWSIGGSLLSFVALMIGIVLKGSLSFLLIAFFGTAMLADLFAGLYMIFGRRQWLMPKLSNFKRRQAKWLLKTGGQIWLVQLSAILMFQTDLIIVARLFGASEVTSYGITLKLFGVIINTSHTFLNPLWPAYSEALARNDIPWIVNIFKKSIFISLSWSIFAGLALSILCPSIVSSWVNQDAIPSQGLIFAMLFTSIITILAHCVGMLINGLCEFSIAVKFGIFQGFLNIFLSLFLGKLIGVSGIAWSTGICFLIFSIGFMGYSVTKKLKIMHNEYKLSHY